MEIFITTSELLEKAEKLIGIPEMSVAQINYNKLLRWQREGLLPRQKSSGAGPGGRQESLWDKSCIGRLQIIAGCVKGKRLNRRKAERALIASGFWIQGDLLKKHLFAACNQMSAELEKQQRSESSHPVDRAANLERSTSERMSAHGDLVKMIFAACRLGYTDLSEEAERFTSLAKLSSFFHPEALQMLIENSPPEQLELIYQNSKMISFADFVARFFDLMCGQSKELVIPGFADNFFMAQLLNKLLPKPDGKLRRKKLYPYSKEKVQYITHLTAVMLDLVYCQNKEEFHRLFPLTVAEILSNQRMLPPDQINDILNTRVENSNELFNVPSMSK